VYVVAFCGVLLATPAFAQPSGPTGSGGAEPSSAGSASESANHRSDRARDEERQICRRIESDASTRLRSRLVCHTAQEWREAQRND
jgi:hypothetical protein